MYSTRCTVEHTFVSALFDALSQHLIRKNAQFVLEMSYTTCRMCVSSTSMKASTALLAFLAEQPDHRFYDPEGRVNRLLRDAIEYPGSPGGMSQLLAGLEAKGQIHRVLHGRRCPVVELTALGVEALAAEGLSGVSPSAPSKMSVKAATAPEKKKPGRPRKVVEESVEESVEEVVEEAAAAPEKRKPGRPRKVVEEVAEEAVEGVVEEVVPTAASPRKKASTTVAVAADDAWETPVAAAPEKRKPGRPRKVDVTGSVTDPVTATDTELLDTELLDTSEIAQALLSLVVSELSSLDGRTASEAAIREELAQSAARTEALEERARSLEDSLAYAKAEAQAERARADRLEKNLDAVMKGPDKSRGKEEARRQLERLISSRPGR